MKNGLSINGGGIRGSSLFASWRIWNSRRGSSRARFFSYVAGTSTGALLAAG